MNPDDEPSIRSTVATTDDSGKFCALAFKLWADKFVGKLVFFRVYSGTITKGDTVYNPRTRTQRARRPPDPDPGRRAQGHRDLLRRRHRRDGRA